MLTVFSERKTPLGGFDYSIIRRLLGSPTYIDEISLFVRETAQNSWDARLNDSSVNDVNYNFTIKAFNEKQSSVFKNKIFCGNNETTKLVNLLNKVTEKDQPYIIIEDSGTVGLAGPTEADIACPTTNFVSFVRNIGQDKHDQHSGGAFGFGKSVFFRFSSVKTIITYTRTRDENGVIVSRLMGMSLFKENDGHTGRHWWGVPPKTGSRDYNQPLAGELADKLAEEIGFKVYDSSKTGTAVMMLGPQFPSSSSAGSEQLLTKNGRAQFLNVVKEALQIWYWPRMVGSGNQDGKLCCTLVSDFSAEDKIDPYNLPDPLNAYLVCLLEIQKIIADPTHKVDPQLIIKPIKKNSEDFYGYLCIFKLYKTTRPHFESKTVTPNHSFGSALWGTSTDEAANCRHVALIRAPGQVVKYEKTTDSSSPASEYGAVFFLCPNGPNAQKIESEVKTSEPASHDDWSSQANQTVPEILKRIRSEVQSVINPKTTSNPDSTQLMGKVSLRLGGLWGEGEAEGGTTPPGGGGGGGGGGSGATIKYDVELGEFNKMKCVFIKIRQPIRIPSGTEFIEISAKARTIGGGTIDVDSEVGEPASENGLLPGDVIGWFSGDDKNPPLEKIFSTPLLPVEKLTPEVRAKGIYAVIKNAESFGISVTLKFKSNG
jgi:hypothetical protein